MVERAKALLIDYDEITRAGLKAILDGGSVAEVVGAVASLKDLPAQLLALTPDLVITNVTNEDGLDIVEVMRLIKHASPNVRVIIITESGNDPHALSAVEAGISAYLLRKDVTGEALSTVIQTVLKTGGAVISAPLMRTVISSLTTNANHTLGRLVEDSAMDLTHREVDVLRLMGTGLTNKEIAQRLGISHETTRKHVTQVVQKLDAQNRTHAAILAARSGMTGPN